MLTRATTYDDVCRLMRWQIPERYNMGVDVCDKHADRTPEAVALIVEDEDGDVVRYSFESLRRLTNRLANVLAGSGLNRGDRLAVLLTQSVETGMAHIAAWKAGLVSIPMFSLFGEEALEYRLTNSGARALVTDEAGFAKIAAIRDRLPDLDVVLLVDARADGRGFTAFWPAIDRASDAFTPVDTAAEDPGLIIYTSGTTGSPKGAYHAHRALLGHLPSVEFFNEFLPQPGDLMWTPARLGVDRRADERADGVVASRRHGARPARPQVRPRACAGADGAARGAQRVHAADGAPADAPGRGGHRPLWLRPPHPHLRRRAHGRGASRLVP